MFPQRVVEQLRRIDLRAVLKCLGAVPDRSDENKWHTSQGIVSVTDQKFMNWRRYCGGGGAIDLVIHLKQCDFKTAVLWLSENFSVPPTPTPSEASPGIPLRLPERDDSKLDRIVHYLNSLRGISPSLLDLLLDSGRLYADPKANAVFLLLGKEKNIVGAELRGTGSVQWRGMARGSRKDLGYFYLQCRQAKAVSLCESAIDAVSCVELYRDCMGVSTSGANPNPAWLKSLIAKGHNIFCAFDADPTGDRLAAKMIQLHPAVKRLRPVRKDWNDVLKAVKRSACSKGQLI